MNEILLFLLLYFVVWESFILRVNSRSLVRKQKTIFDLDQSIFVYFACKQNEVLLFVLEIQYHCLV